MNMGCGIFSLIFFILLLIFIVKDLFINGFRGEELTLLLFCVIFSIIWFGLRKYVIIHFKKESLEINQSIKSDDNITEQIEKLYDLKENGILTQKEFDQKKSELLKKL